MTTKKRSTPTLVEFRGRESQGIIEAFEDTAENGMRARIRIIKAGVSKNNRNYRKTALQKAAQEGVFDDLKMFVGHSKDVPLKRDMGSFVSYTDGVEYVEATESLEGWAKFVDRPFFEKAKAAEHHIGVSIDSQLSGVVTPSTTGGRRYEDIYAFTQPRSVDWVLFPAAGGKVLAWEEEEGDNVIDWAAVEAEAGTLTDEELKQKLPTIWAKAHAKKSFTGTEGDDGDEGDEGNPEPVKGKAKAKKTDLIGKEEVADIVREALTAHDREAASIRQKQEAAAEEVRKAFASSGLPERTRSRVMQGFEGVQEFDKDKVQKAIDDAKEELKELGLGPKLTGFGPSGGTEKGDDDKATFSAHESVSGIFGKKTAAKSDDPEGDK